MSRKEDRETIIKAPGHTYYITLRRGWRTDEVMVRKDVWPALGGLIGRGRHPRDESDALYEKIFAEYRELFPQASLQFTGESPEPSPISVKGPGPEWDKP